MATVIELGQRPIDPNMPPLDRSERPGNPWLSFDAWLYMKSHGFIRSTPSERAYDYLEAAGVPTTLRQLAEEVAAPDALDARRGVALVTTQELYSGQVQESLRWGWIQVRPEINAALMRYKEIRVSASNYEIGCVEVTQNGVLRNIRQIMVDPRPSRMFDVFAQRHGIQDRNSVSYDKVLRFAALIAS